MNTHRNNCRKALVARLLGGIAFTAVASLGLMGCQSGGGALYNRSTVPIPTIVENGEADSTNVAGVVASTNVRLPSGGAVTDRCIENELMMNNYLLRTRQAPNPQSWVGAQYALQLISTARDCANLTTFNIPLPSSNGFGTFGGGNGLRF